MTNTTAPATSRPGIVSLALCLGIFASLAVGANDQIPGPAQDHPILLRGADLYTISGGVLVATDLLFENGKITAIGKNLTAPEGVEILDVAGQRIYPGIIAPATALGLTEISAVRATDDTGEDAADFTPEVTPLTAFNYDSEILATIRNHGITTAQIFPQSNLIRGRPFITQLDGWSTADATVVAHDGLLIGWPRLPREPDDTTSQESRDALRRAFTEASAYRTAKAASRDGSGLASDLAIDQRWDAMIPVLAGEQSLYVVADDYQQITQAVSFARDFDLHMVLVGGTDAYLAADLLAREDIPVLLVKSQDLPARQDEGYDVPYRRAALLHEAGVRFAFTDSGASGQRNLPFQAGQSVGFGLPADVALRSLTLTTAEILGIADRQGSLEVGKDATLFVSRGDVMDALTQDVTHVFIEGRTVDLDDKQRELDRKYRTKLERLQADD
ncbi:MAG: amidohydrolase family protein [Thermoanaerobaculia bacterium]|nr:amidohydrolase family protein [Thermoanaerobaculia bacterium]